MARRKKTPHTNAFPGKRVRVKLLDGTIYIGKFKEGNDRIMVLELPSGAVKINKKQVRSFGIWKLGDPE